MSTHRDHLTIVNRSNGSSHVHGDRASGILPSPHAGGTSEWLARDAMREPALIVLASSKVRTAVEMLRTLDLRYLPVVNAAGALVGVLGDRDLAALRIPYFVGNEYVGNLQSVLEMPVASLLNGRPVSIFEDADLLDALNSMLREQMAIVPVIDAAGVLVGVIDYLDLLRRWPLADSAQVAAG